MIDEIYRELQKRISHFSEHRSWSDDIREDTLNVFKAWIDDLYKKTTPSDLDAVAKRYESFYDVDDSQSSLCTAKGDIADAFKAGVRWILTQGIIEFGTMRTDNGRTRVSFGMGYDPFRRMGGEFQNGDKLIVQIRKIENQENDKNHVNNREAPLSFDRTKLQVRAMPRDEDVDEIPDWNDAALERVNAMVRRARAAQAQAANDALQAAVNAEAPNIPDDVMHEHVNANRPLDQFLENLI